MYGASFSLTVLPETECVAPGDCRAAFVLRIAPSEGGPGPRPPLRLVLAIDTSGSMEGEKLWAVMASARAVIEALSADDMFACVTFDSEARTLLGPTAMTAGGKAEALSRLSRPWAEGGTDLGSALLRSLEAAGGGRVLLLTDGCPTEGVLDHGELVRLVEGCRGASTLSTFGFGRDVNPQLLLDLAEAARGTYTFIEDDTPPLAAMAAELGGMASVVATEAVLTVRPSDNVWIERVHRARGVHFDRGAGALWVDLGALIAGEPVCVPIELGWSAEAADKPLAMATFRAWRPESSRPVCKQALIAPRAAARRGPFVREAAREVLLGQASVLLHQASSAPPLQLRDLLGRLGALHAAAWAAGLGDDEPTRAALALVREAQQGLGGDPCSARHDALASSLALAQRRSARVGGPGADRHAAFASRSQRAGWRLLRPGSPPSPTG